MKAIGGYFSLELPVETNGELHQGAIRLNSGRSCFEYILRSKKYRKVYLPYYMCDAVMEPIRKLGLQYQFYRINEKLQICENIQPKPNEVVLYCNYFGLQDHYVKEVASRFAPQIIIDNTQAFFSRQIPGVDMFYTCRKFFGVADGAYLYTDTELEFDIPQDYSSQRMLHLIDRLDHSAEEAFSEYHIAEESLRDAGIKRMSGITEQIMKSIDYKKVIARRISNFRHVAAHLDSTNLYHINPDPDCVPMVYPYLYQSAGLKQTLIDHRIYVPTFWPNVKDWAIDGSLELFLYDKMVNIPIDQRYNDEDMSHILNIIDTYHER